MTHSIENDSKNSIVLLLLRLSLNSRKPILSSFVEKVFAYTSLSENCTFRTFKGSTTFMKCQQLIDGQKNKKARAKNTTWKSSNKIRKKGGDDAQLFGTLKNTYDKPLCDVVFSSPSLVLLHECLIGSKDFVALEVVILAKRLNLSSTSSSSLGNFHNSYMEITKF